MGDEQNSGITLVRKSGQSAEDLPVDVDTIATLIAERYPATSVSEARNIILDMASHFGYSQQGDMVDSGSISSNVHSLRFAELLDADGRKIHVGCIMAVGEDWVEVSFPTRMTLQSGIELRFLPSPKVHKVDLRWRHEDRAGFTYPDGTPPDAPQMEEAGLLDPRSAQEKMLE